MGGLSATGSKDALLARLRLREKKQKKKNEREDSSLSLLQTNSPHSTRKMTPGKKSREITKPTSLSSSSLQEDIKVISTRTTTTTSRSSAKENRKRASNASVETIIDSSD